ncbi:hypothetical protein FA15DRAFT_710020 [Coprinopsis marcescibilis]|uniref:Uncharacterized protein n=1 Tax=Coprinopsis marcescibilis TaxID=230819 RepID=A0A5C3KDV7_COPMA|nr:hypothetical protein FA15DRAFT_710020 [Coprinopsis marcescibilis]
MKPATAAALLSLSVLANAHGDRAAHRRHGEGLAARQAPSLITSLDATNPTAVPLSAIVPGARGSKRPRPS